MTPTAAADKTTGIRIQRALAKPGARGKKGFLLWVEAAFPAKLAQPILEAAARADAELNRTKYVAPGLGAFGDSTDDSALQEIVISSSPEVPPVSSTTAGTDASAADPSWVNALSSAVQAAGQAYLTKTQLDAAQSIFNTNLQRANKGLPPIPTNPTQYGLPAPTVNVGLAQGTLTPLLWGGGILLGILFIASMAKHR